MISRWLSFLVFGRKAFVGHGRAWWGAVTEAMFAAIMVLIGFVMLVTFVTSAVLYSTPEELYISVGQFVLRLVVASGLILLGVYRAMATIWKVGASAERREAIVSRAGEIELLNELRNSHANLPGIPADKYPPIRGDQLRFELLSSRRSTWGLLITAMLAILFAGITTILIMTSIASFERGAGDWLAVAASVAFCFAALWASSQFTNNFLGLTGTGVPTLEIDRYPLVPGNQYKMHISQPGRVRLKLLVVKLQCEEEATYSQGTDIRTERRVVHEQRLFRRRGVSLQTYKPLEEVFEFTLKPDAMHSFKSSSNRILWSIVIESQAKGWPSQQRRFRVTVIPRTSVPPQTGKVATSGSRSTE